MRDAHRRRGALHRRPRTPACTATPSAPCRRAACPRRSSRRSRNRSPRLVRRYARTHGPVHHRRARPIGTASTSGRCCASSSAPATSSAASCGRAAASASGATPRCCAACGAPRSQRCARRSSPPSRGRWRASCPPGRAWTPRRPAAPGSTACARCSCRSRASRSRPRRGSATCCRAGWAPTRRPGWTSSARGGELVWVGAGALGRSSGKVALVLPRGRAAARAAAVKGGRRPPSRCTTAIRERLDAGAAFWTDLLVDVEAEPRRAAGGALGSGVGGRGDERRLRAAARAAPVAGRARARSARPPLLAPAPSRRARSSRAAGR